MTPQNSAGAVSGGTVLQIGAVHGDVRLASPPVPRQPPAPPRFFTDREAELHRLHGVLGDPAGRTVVLSGTGGVGKSALALRFLDAAATEFPDGVLYTDLRGFTEGGPADPADSLDAFLRGLGGTPGTIPRDLAGRAAAFRSLTHGRRVAVLVENAVSAAQVRVLSPGPGPHLVLVTTRLHLTGLRVDGAEFLDLHPLAEDDAVVLVDRILADDRTRSDPGSARELVRLCGRLPLALRAAASGLLLRPRRPLSRMVASLDGEHLLDRFGEAEEPSVDAVLTASYRLLPPPNRRLHRLLGMLPGRDTTAEAAAALQGCAPERAEELLAELVAASLLEETPQGRFVQHDLVRLHAARRAREEDPPTEREQALDRLLLHLLATAAAADRTLNPGRWHLAPVFEEPPVRGFASRREALEWLETELDVLRACVDLCTGTGRHRWAWQFCECLRNVFMLRKHFDAWERTHLAGLASAEALGDPAAQGNVLNALGGLYLTLGDVDRAREIHLRALAEWTRADHRLGRASALEACGVCELARDRPADALPYFERALEIHTDLGRRRGIALLHRRLGEARRDLGDHDAAAEQLGRALEFFTEDADPYMRVRSQVSLAAVHVAAGRPEHAREVLAEVLRLAADIGARAEEARARVMSADLAEAEGDLDRARGLLTEALAIHTELSAPEAGELRRRLGSPPYTDGP
ncbi:tetratricopeptide repeat protein [Nocardiopsis sp. CC223A]|uniref:tetratricopeptide repeat protein n=1 Tax=Nocardiopsis sp. CC223A TaxID=3044051 RepID=UPI00278BE2F6|nr:tetratricopeptide repeat protein [Nocardiopsis sp. CC223A]